MSTSSRRRVTRPAAPVARRAASTTSTVGVTGPAVTVAVPPRYPFQEVGERAPLEEAGLSTLAQAESAAGQGKPTAVIPRAFLLSTKALSSVGPSVPGFKPPQWVRSLTRAKQTPQQVLDTLQQRVLQNPTAQNLQEAQMLLNDLGRLQDGGTLLRAKITQRLVDQLIGKGG